MRKVHESWLNLNYVKFFCRQAVEMLETVLTSLYSDKMKCDLAGGKLWSALKSRDGLHSLSFAIAVLVRLVQYVVAMHCLEPVAIFLRCVTCCSS